MWSSFIFFSVSESSDGFFLLIILHAVHLHASVSHIHSNSSSHSSDDSDLDESGSAGGTGSPSATTKLDVPGAVVSPSKPSNTASSDRDSNFFLFNLAFFFPETLFTLFDLVTRGVVVT